VTFYQLVSILWRRRLVVAASVVATVVLAGVYLEVRTPTWTASATVALEPTSTSGASPGGAAVATPPGLQNPLSLLASSQVAKSAAKIAGPRNAGGLQGEVSGTLDTTGTILTIVGTAGSAETARDAANAYAEAFVQDVQSVIQASINNLQAQINALNLQIIALQKTNSPNSPELMAANNELTNLYGQKANLQVETNSFAVVQQPATLPSSPSGLDMKKVLGIAVLVGLLAGCGIAFVREQLDMSLRSRSGVKELTNAPVLAELPFDREFSLDNGTLAVLDLPGAPLAESVRELRTSLEVILEDKPCPVVLITSASPEDGKTFVVANLAASWAISGKRVVVVSADLRRPRIEQALRVEAGSPGLKDLAALDRRDEFPATTKEPPIVSKPEDFAGAPPGFEHRPSSKSSSRWLYSQTRTRPLPSQHDVVSALRTTRVPGLSLLPSGGVATNSSELVNSAGMKAVMDRLSAVADVVVIDSPPLMAVSDAAILSRHTDGTVVVAVEGQTSSPVLQRTLERLEAARSLVLGIVLNRVHATSASAYNRYYGQPPPNR
jgi:Mrp family chromosome partitioning ATPase/capsular polysaccharide biosynthesis protein